MRLFSVPSGSVDRHTRAWLLTVPFDLALTTTTVPIKIVASITATRPTITITATKPTITVSVT